VTDMDMKIILLVEDDAIIALTEKMSLETYGYSVVTVSSGEKALNSENNEREGRY